MNNKWIWIAVISCWAAASRPNVVEACGLIIPVDGETASLDAQRVTMAYFPEENRTRVMAQIGYVGDLTNFSWIIPLPSEPTEVQAVDDAGATIFADLDTLSEPEFLLSDWTCALNNGGGDGGTPVAVPGVEVLQHGNTGAFEYVVLSGTGGSVVVEWLAENGYSLPDGMEEVAHTYIREGAVFMAMKVNLEALALGQIDPAISFDYVGWPGYPLRILQPAASEEVEIILNVLAPIPAEMANEVILDDSNVRWANQEPQYLDAVRRAGNWVVERRGPLSSRWVETEDGNGEELMPPRDLMQEVLGIPAESEVVLSRFHGIFKPAQLTEDTALNLREDINPTYSTFTLDITRSEDCGWDDNIVDDVDDSGDSCFQGSCGGSGGGSGGGCSTTSGSLGSPLLLLFGFLVFGRSFRRRKPGSARSRPN